MLMESGNFVIAATGRCFGLTLRGCTQFASKICPVIYRGYPEKKGNAVFFQSPK